MQFTDPTVFEKILAPTGGEVRARPLTGSRFRLSLEIRPSRKVRMFTVDSDSYWLQKVPQYEHYSLNIPLKSTFTVNEPGYEQTFGPANAYISCPGLPITFAAKKKCNVITCQFPIDSLKMYRQRMLQETKSGNQALDHHLSLMSAAGSDLFRSAIRTWVARGQQDDSLNDIALLEMEDDLLASFLSLAEDSAANRKPIALPADRALKDIEDYICANLDTTITRDELANRVGVPIRSLSRAFEKKYGLGPAAFVRQRRLDACYRYLRGSERGETTVTRVAMSHGFEHLGKFSVAYKETFGESPSATFSTKGIPLVFASSICSKLI